MFSVHISFLFLVAIFYFQVLFLFLFLYFYLIFYHMLISCLFTICRFGARMYVRVRMHTKQALSLSVHADQHTIIFKDYF